MNTFDYWKTTEPDYADEEFAAAAAYRAGYNDGYSHGYESAAHDAEVAREERGGPILFAYMLFGLSGSVVGFLIGWFL